ncbi:MAG: YsnF/AvaK domain-containing protein [Gemmatimonadota bacterium]
MSNIDRDLPLDRNDNLRDRVEDEARLTLSEEELALRKERHLAGEVEIGKHVETQHVTREVPVSREEVTIERRPITDGMHATGRIGEDEHIRVPLEREEVIAEKRVVPKEELVVRKHQVEEERMVETDLRRERADVEGDTHLGDRDRLTDRDRL